MHRCITPINRTKERLNQRPLKNEEAKPETKHMNVASKPRKAVVLNSFVE